MTPNTSKRPFLHPVPADAVDHFTHPTHPAFRQPWQHDGHLWAAGLLALRFRPSFAIAPSEYPAAPQEFADRVGTLPWERFPAAAAQPKAWRCLDDHRGTIYGDPVAPFWLEVRPGRWIYDPRKLVRICGAPIVPLSVLQLLARLPRPEIHTAGCTVEGPVLFRFSGGEGIIPHLGHTSGAAFELLKPRDSAADHRF